MEQYISKSALVAEIERRIKKYATIDVGNSSELDALYGAKCHALKSILTFLDTLEVKEINVNKEIENFEEKIIKSSKAYRAYREECGIKDPILLDEVEEAYYAAKEYPKR